MSKLQKVFGNFDIKQTYNSYQKLIIMNRKTHYGVVR